MRVASIVLVSCLCLAACAQRAAQPSAPSAPTIGPLGAIDPLPKPSLPPWIAEISPAGTADENAQIRIRFASDIVPVQDLAKTDRAAVLANFTLEPAIPGRFILYTPRLAAFAADVPLPLSSRFRVTVHAGLADLAGHRLERDLAWTFETTHIELSGIPGQDRSVEEPAVGLRPRIDVIATVALDPASLAAHAQLRPDAGSSAAPISLDPVVATPSPSPQPAAASDAEGARGSPSFPYALSPRQPLAPGTSYRVVLAAGVAPLVGNLATARSFGGRIRVRGPLAFVRVEPYERPFDSGGIGRFVGGAPQLDFSNALDATSARAAVHLSPAPRSLDIEASDGDTFVRIGSAGLAPNTRYAITVDATLRDAFGQALAAPVSATFATTDLAADLWAPTGMAIFPASRDLQLNVYATNLPLGTVAEAFRVVAPTDLVDAEDPTPASSGALSLAPPDSALRSVAIRGQKNVQTLATVPLRERLGGATGMLSYGISGQTNRYRNDAGNVAWAMPQFYGVVELTNLGVFAQWFPHGGIVRVNRLSDGGPVAGANVRVYESRVDLQLPPGRRPPAEPCASGETDAQGTLVVDGAQFAPCAATSTSATDAPSLLVVASAGTDWASVRTWAWSGAYEPGLNGGWSAGEPESRGAIIADRSLYQPGETAYFAGLAYFVTDGVLARGKAASYALTLESPSGNKRAIGTAAPDAFGAFSVTLPLAPGQELGDYTLHARAANGEEVDGSFRVAEFKPPNFKVALTLDRQFAEPRSRVRAAAQSDYLFGAPVSGGEAHLDVTRERTYFSPAGWESWDFGRQWLYPEDEPSAAPDVLQRDLPVGAGGGVAFDVPVGNDVPYAMTYRVDAQTTDVANVAVSDSKTFTALPSPALIGLSASFVATAGQPLSVKAIVTDPAGKAIAGRALHLVLEKRTYVRATQIVEGAEQPRESVTYARADAADLTSAATPQSVSLTARDPGEYRVRATFAGASDERAATDHVVWVAGPGGADWATAQGNALSVKLDKPSYHPGEIATAVVASPYANAQLDFAVVRAGVLYEERRIVSGAAPQIRFRVTEAMLPNAAVQALLIRRGPLPSGIRGGTGDLARVGFAALATSLDSKTLKVALAAQSATLLPGARQRVHVHVADAAGGGVRGEVALMVVNDAVLQLTGYRPPDLVATVYAEQSISTRFADSRSDVVLASPERPSEKGYGFGGGFLAGAGSTRIRTNFKPVAYFNGAVHTDARGDAVVDFALPDDLTTWRMLALAFTTDARFGNGEGTFVATKPLIANPVLPQFARPGDTFDGGVSIANTAKASGTLGLRGVLSGGLAFAQASGRDPKVSAQEPAPAAVGAYRFPIVVTSPAQGTVQFGASLAGANDAFAIPLPVRTSDVLESVVATGATTGQASVPVVVDAAVPRDAGGLDVDVASSIVPNVAEPIRRAVADDTAFGDSLVARIDVAADAVLLAHLYRRAPAADVEAALARGLALLLGQRTPDGGIAPWPNAQASDPFLDADAFSALAHAKAAGIAAAAQQVAHLRPVLERTLANPAVHKGYGDEPLRSEVRLATLAALAQDGIVRTDFLAQIVAQEKRFDLDRRFALARLLVRAPAWSQEARSLSAALMQDVAETAHAAAIVTSYETVGAQAGAVRLLAASHAAPDLIDGALSALVGMQRDGTWGCSCADALALDAVVDYAALQPVPPNFTVDVRVGAGPPRTFSFHGYAVTEGSLHVAMRDLSAGTTAVTMTKRGTGTVRYAVTYRYRVRADAPGRYHGLRLDRYVRAAGSEQPIAAFGLETAAPLTLAASGVFEIEDRIITDHPVDRVMVVDPLPAGLEAVDTSFVTSSRAVQARTDNWEIDYQQIYHDRVEAFAGHLPAGVYALHYLVRSVTPGTFVWPAGDVHLERAPDEFGRTGSGTLVVHGAG